MLKNIIAVAIAAALSTAALAETPAANVARPGDTGKPAVVAPASATPTPAAAATTIAKPEVKAEDKPAVGKPAPHKTPVKKVHHKRQKVSAEKAVSAPAVTPAPAPAPAPAK